MEINDLKYFLAANSCQGFVSGFNNCYDAERGWKAYIIKGGPGTGKSSFMKFVAKSALEKGIKTEIFPCSSDPDSLDAVIFPNKKIVIMDGTSPHTVDPLYPGVCEQILNFGDFWGKEKFVGKERDVIAATKKNKLVHKRASRYLQAAGEFLTDNFKIAEACTDKERAGVFAKKLCKKYINRKKNGNNAKEWVRFLSGITPKGVVSYPDTVLKECKKTVIISDEYGSVTDVIMKYIRDYSLGCGHEVLTIKNAFLPESLTDGVILPELSLAFIREYDHFTLKTEERRIHARRFVYAGLMAKSRKRLKFNKKTADKLLLSASECLMEAKTAHDELEKLYISAMDFNALSRFAEKIAKDITDI